MENAENEIPLPNGMPLSPDDARQYISAFQTHLCSLDPSTDLETLGIGQKFDLTKLKDFIKAIDDHEKKLEIDAVRIYLARSTRRGKIDENYDVVLVPVLKNNEDLHHLYDTGAALTELPTILGEASPCPSVCGFVKLL